MGLVLGVVNELLLQISFAIQAQLEMDVTIQGVPQSAWGQSRLHLFCTNTKIIDAKFCEPAQ